MTNTSRQVAGAILLTVFLYAAGVTTARAQVIEPRHADRHLQVGLGLAPGIGFQVGYVIPVTFVTGEAMGYFNFSPGYGGGEGNIQLAAAVGGSMRIFQILRETGAESVRDYDLDIGMRLGPEFFIALTPEDRPVDPTQTFNLFAEPYARGTTTIRRGRVVYLEVGIRPPLFRGGLMFGL